MTTRTPERSPLFYARAAGLAYLLIIVSGIFAEFAVRANLIVGGDASATAQNIVASETLFRGGFIGDLIMLVCDAFVAVVLYLLLKPVSRSLALLAMSFRLLHTAILGANLLNHFAALLLLSGSEYLAAFTVGQLQALSLFFLDAHSHGYLIAQVFFAVHCAILGYLLFASESFPRLLGVLMALASVGYLMESMVVFLVPRYEAATAPGLMVAGVAELSLCIWLLVKGVRWSGPGPRLGSGVVGTAVVLALAVAVGGCDDGTDLYKGPPIEMPELPSYRYPMQIDEEAESLVDQDGKPFFLQGDAGWSLISGTKREDMQLYLDDRAARGFNSILVVLIDHTDPLTNAYGEAPFLVDGDFRTPNEAYFRYADEVMEAATSRGLQVWLFPMYLGYKGGDEGFYQDMIASDAAEMRDWGRWVGERYGGMDALVWVIGGDYLPPAEGLALLSEVQAGIAEFDTRHIFTAHWAGDVSGREADVSWVELNNTYTYSPTYTKCREDYESGVLPFVLLESVYENEYGSTVQQIRAQAYYAWLSGAKGQFFGNNPVWNFSGGWKEALNSRGAAGMMHLRGFFAGIEWMKLEPDVDDEFIVSGRGQWGERDFAVLSRDADRTLAVAYVPSPRDLQLDLSSMAGPCEARWFDPTNGSYYPVTASPLPNQAAVEIPAQDPNGDGDGDWILLLQAPN